MKKISKNTKLLIVAAVVLSVLGIILAVLIATEPPKEEEAALDEEHSVETNLTLNSNSAGSIEKVSIENDLDSFDIYVISAGNQTDYLFSNTTSGGDTGPKIDPAIAKTNLSYLAPLTPNSLTEENADIQKYGLAFPRGKITVSFSDKTSYTLNIGDDSPIDGGVYISIDDSDTVYTFPGFKITKFLGDKSGFADLSMVDEYDANFPVGDITINNREGGEIKLTKKVTDENAPASSSHIMVSPYPLELSFQKSERIINGIFGLKAVGIASVDDNYEEYGLVEPITDVRVSYKNENYILKIGNKVPGEGNLYYSTISTVPNIIYKVDKSLLPWINLTPESIMSNIILSPYIYDLDEFQIETMEKEITISVTGSSGAEEFLYQGEKIEAKRAKDLYQFSLSLFAESIYTVEPTEPLIARFTYRYNNAKSDDVIEIYGSEDLKLIVKKNGKTMYKCREAFIRRLITNVDAFINGDEIMLSW